MSDPSLLRDDLALLERAAREAAQVVMGYFKRDPKSWKKHDVSPVSEADLASDDVLRGILTEARPGYGWLSEETEDSPDRLSREAVWIVDPIDGTNAFLNGRPDFTICAALVRGGEAVAGVVVNPVHEQVFAAIKGQGATCNGLPLTVARQDRLADARLLARSNVVKPDRWRTERSLQKPGYIGSLAYQLCVVAKDEWAAAVSVSPLHEWDVAAAGLILAEAKGVLTDQRGAGLSYNKPSPRIDGLVAAAPALSAEILGDLIPREPT